MHHLNKLVIYLNLTSFNTLRKRILNIFARWFHQSWESRSNFYEHLNYMRVYIHTHSKSREMLEMHGLVPLLIQSTALWSLSSLIQAPQQMHQVPVLLGELDDTISKSASRWMTQSLMSFITKSTRPYLEEENKLWAPFLCLSKLSWMHNQ